MVGRLIRNIQEHDRLLEGLTSQYETCKIVYPGVTKGRIIPMAKPAASDKTAENTFRIQNCSGK